ncbi:hypothetical protein PG989_000598 [Apiospora arundinis]
MTAQDPQSFTRKYALQGSKGSRTADDNLLPMPVTPTRGREIPSDFLKSTVCRLLCEVTAQWATKHPFIDYCTARGADLVMVLNEGAGGVTTRRIARLACL